MNEFNLNDDFENYIVVKIFNAPSNYQKVWKKKLHNPICYINYFCYTIPKLTTTKNKIIYEKLSRYWNLIWMQISTKSLSDQVQTW